MCEAKHLKRMQECTYVGVGSDFLAAAYNSPSMLVRSPRSFLQSTSRCLRLISTSNSTKAKQEGDISSVFSSLSGAKAPPLPERFVALKRQIIGASPESLTESWTDLLGSIAIGLQDIRDQGSDIIPEVSFEELTDPYSIDVWSTAARTRGSLIIRDVVPDGLALGWKEQIKEYVRLNPNVKGTSVR
jgi:hypothetical protein